MDYNVLAEIVEKNGHKVKYRITLSNGKTESKRLFYGARGVCEFAQNSRKRGFVIGNEYRDWLSCEPIIQTKDDCYKRFVKRVNFIHNILVKSGMWKEFDKRLFCYILNLSETARYDMFCLLYDTEHYVIADSKNYHAKMDRLQNDFYIHIGDIDMLQNLWKDKCFKTINYEDGLHDFYTDKIENAIANKTNYQQHWTKSYDHSIEITLGDDGVLRGYYSMEYRGCGNGYYYLLLDATHALFYEKD